MHSVCVADIGAILVGDEESHWIERIEQILVLGTALQGDGAPAFPGMELADIAVAVYLLVATLHKELKLQGVEVTLTMREPNLES